MKTDQNKQETIKNNGCFRKIPVTIEAFQMTKKRRYDNSEWPVWLHKAWNREKGEGSLYCIDGDEKLFMGTLEGVYSINWDDWIIKGVNGEIYPCKPDIFRKTYKKNDDFDKQIYLILEKAMTSASSEWMHCDVFLSAEENYKKTLKDLHICIKKYVEQIKGVFLP